MANSNEQALSILIKFGLSDEAAKQALADLDNLKQSTKEAGDSSEYFTNVSKKQAEEVLSGGKAARNSYEAHHALRTAMMELNKVVPGLGEVMNIFSAGMRDSAEATGEAAAATESFITTLGPLAILLLTIQTLITYYSLWKDAAKAAQEQISSSLKKITEDTQAALDTWQNYQDVISGKKEITKPFEDELQKRQRVQQTDYEQAQRILQVQKEGALSQATTPEQKQQVEQDFAQKAEVLKQQNENAQQTILNEVRNEVQKAMIQARTAVETAHATQQEIIARDPHFKLQADKNDFTAATAEEKKQTDAVQKLQDMFDSLSEKLGIAIGQQQSEVTGNRQVRAEQLIQPNDKTIAEGVAAVIERQHGIMTKNNAEALRRLNDAYTQIFGSQEALTAGLTYIYEHAQSQTDAIRTLQEQIRNLTHVQ